MSLLEKLLGTVLLLGFFVKILWWSFLMFVCGRTGAGAMCGKGISTVATGWRMLWGRS